MDTTEQNMPSEEEVGKKIEEKIKKNVPKYAEGIAGTIAVAVFIILLNVFYDNVRLLNDDFTKVLPIINFSLAVSLLINASTIFIHSTVYKRITTLIGNLIFFVVAYQVWIVFPFDTSYINLDFNWDGLIRLVMAITIIAVLVASIVDIVRLIRGK